MRNIEPILRTNLLRLARAYAKARGGIKLATVSRRACGDSPYLDKLAAGVAGVSGGTYDRARRWFEKNRPPQMRWPKINEPWDVPAKRQAEKTDGRPQDAGGERGAGG